MTTYAELTTQLQNWAQVDDNVFTSTIVDDFIQNAEYRLMTELDLDAFRRVDHSTLTSGNNFLSAPTGILYIRYLRTRDGDNDFNYLLQKDVSYMTEYAFDRATEGTPKYYANYSATEIYIAPTPSSDLYVELGYVKRPNNDDGTKLSSTNTTTYLSLNAPNTLLYACLVEAFTFLKDMNMVQLYEQKFIRSLEALGIEQDGHRRQDEYMNGVMRRPLPQARPSLIQTKT